MGMARGHGNERQFSKKERTQIYNLYVKEHKSIKDIQGKFKAGESSIRRVLKDEGVQIRPAGYGGRRNCCNSIRGGSHLPNCDFGR
jgi:transposase